MHDIEPFHNWRDEYIASEDKHSPFFRRQYSEFYFENRVYNYLIHPQWDDFGSSTLYIKILYADYFEGYAIIELIGEWNDCIDNDIMFLKRDVIDALLKEGIYRYILICENVLNFHSGDDDYYQEWYEDVQDEFGWIVLLNTLDHVKDELKSAQLKSYLHFGKKYNQINWRPHKPKVVYRVIEALVNGQIKHLPG